jgi:bacterial/archaeal transporter family-2 protein
MNSTSLSYAVLALLAGVGIPTMARLNASLGQAVDSPAWSALLLFGVAFVGTALFLVLTRQAFPTGWGTAARYTYLGGLLVAFYVLSITFLIPRFGMVPSILAVLVGQIVATAGIEHFGLLGNAQRPIDLIRAVGIIIMFSGLVIVIRPTSH